MTTATKKVKLNLSERMFAITIINAYKGGLETLAYLLDDSKKLGIVEEEWEAANRKKSPALDKDGNPQEVWAWNDEKGGEKEIELAKQTASYIAGEIEKKDKAGEYTVADKAAITLKEKLT